MTLLAGSNTVRGIINDELDVEIALKIGKTIGLTYGSPVAVAMDGRPSNIMLKSALVAGIMSVGCDVMDLGIVPTPLMQYHMVHNPDIKAGVNITATFAGQQINGFRVLKAGGIEDPIFDKITMDSIMAQNKQVPAMEVGRIYKVADIAESYIDHVISKVDAEAIRQANLRVCVDCRNVAVAKIISGLLMKLSVDRLTIGGDSSVMDRERMIKLGDIVKSQNLNLGIAIEMDADHCLFVSEDGRPVQGDKSFAIFAKNMLAENKGKVVMPINSSTLMEDVVNENGGLVIFCTIGEQTVVRKVKENVAVFGGDIFGCTVIPSEIQTCDSILAMVKMLEIVVKEGPMSKLVEPFPTYCISRGSFECPEEEINRILDRFKAEHEGERMELVDGIKVFNDKGWILVRHSNVKGVIKLYAQSDSYETSDTWIRETIENLSKKEQEEKEEVTA